MGRHKHKPQCCCVHWAQRVQQSCFWHRKCQIGKRSHCRTLGTLAFPKKQVTICKLTWEGHCRALGTLGFPKNEIKKKASDHLQMNPEMALCSNGRQECQQELFDREKILDKKMSKIVPGEGRQSKGHVGWGISFEQQKVTPSSLHEITGRKWSWKELGFVILSWPEVVLAWRSF